MVEFRFDIKPLFPQPIIKVCSNLLPQNFRGDRRQALDATSKISEIIDNLGQLSATSQKLAKPVTSAQKLRMADNQRLYLLSDIDAGHNGSVIGLLKVGTKNLYLFDEDGETRKVEDVPCILDFYVHESRQRSGFGKDMFETMLREEHWVPVKCSVDRPSEKLLAFLKKYYGLMQTIPQSNNFVLYKGFFIGENSDINQNRRQSNDVRVTTGGPNSQLFGACYVGEDEQKRRLRQLDAVAAECAQMTQLAPAGRFGAPRPTCSMAEIIHCNLTSDKGGAEVSSTISPQPESAATAAGVAVAVATADSAGIENCDYSQGDEAESRHTIGDEPSYGAKITPILVDAGDTKAFKPMQNDECTEMMDNDMEKMPSVAGSPSNGVSLKKPTTFQLSKQHTGMKNMSTGVGMAVTPTNKMEFDQEAREDFGVVKINRPLGGGKLRAQSNNADIADAVTTATANMGLTDQGYYDLKYYHNKLW